jgi:hypothetical protein
MNKHIINHSQEENQVENVRGDRNLLSKCFVPSENNRTFEVYSFVEKVFDEEKNIFQEISIKTFYDPELGNLNTFDQRVYFCLVYVWECQGRPNKAVFSLRELARLLNINPSNTTSIKQSLKRLRVIRIDWNGAFYDYLLNKFVHLENPFTILNHLVISSTKKRDTKKQSLCEFSFDEHIVNNYFNRGTKPINFLAIRSLKSSAQLLYLLLDSKMYGTNELTILTENLFIELGFTQERYKQPHYRFKDLNKWKKYIIGSVTGYKEVFNYFEIETAKGTKKDKNLVVKRTGAKKISFSLDFNFQNTLCVLANNQYPTHTQQDAPSESLTIQPMQIVGQERQALKTQNKGNTERVLKQTKSKPQKTESVLSGREELSDIDILLNSFAAKFPEAQPAEKASQKVRKNVEALLKIYPIEQVEDFLDFCLELGHQEQYQKVIEGNTFNYLIEYKIGNQLLIDAWLQSRAEKIKCQKRAEKLERKNNIKTLEDFERVYLPEYVNYAKNYYLNLTKEMQTEYNIYVDFQLEEKFQDIKDKKEREKRKMEVRKNHKKSILFLRQFYHERLRIIVYTFEQWALVNYPEEYSRVKESNNNF